MQSQSDYSWLDRTLHKLAFGSPALQRILAELEDDLYRKRVAQVPAGREVFVTGLARSGTTLVLNLLYGSGEFTTFTYRHMPFLLLPILWPKMSSPFQQAATERERAHGDQVAVSFDSPEAFEEAIWLAYMREGIEQQDRLLPVPADGYSKELARGLRSTIAKLRASSVLTSPNQAVDAPRYLSKNNANVSRIPALRRLFPKAVILVPFREPAAHVASLMQQHERFLAQHETDQFSRQYMRWLGHFEFGGNFKPIDFSGWLQGRQWQPAEVDQDFWLEYWINAYRYLLEHRDSSVHPVDFDGLISGGAGGLRALATAARLRAPEVLDARAETLRAPTTSPLLPEQFNQDLWQRAVDLHGELCAQAQAGPA